MAIKIQEFSSASMFEQIDQMICQHNLKPVADKVLNLEKRKEALKYMENGSHFGQIVLKIS